MMMRFDTLEPAAPPAAPKDRDASGAQRARQIDLDRVVWDQEYRQEVLEALKAGN